MKTSLRPTYRRTSFKRSYLITKTENFGKWFFRYELASKYYMQKHHCSSIINSLRIIPILAKSVCGFILVHSLAPLVDAGTPGVGVIRRGYVMTFSGIPKTEMKIFMSKNFKSQIPDFEDLS